MQLAPDDDPPPARTICRDCGLVYGMTYRRFPSPPDAERPCAACRDADAAAAADGRGPRLVRLTPPGVDGQDFRGVAAGAARP